jgi:cold shock CspA family protein
MESRQEEQTVEFDIEQGRKSLQAANVRITPSRPGHRTVSGG